MKSHLAMYSHLYGTVHPLCQNIAEDHIYCNVYLRLIKNLGLIEPVRRPPQWMECDFIIYIVIIIRGRDFV